MNHQKHIYIYIYIYKQAIPSHTERLQEEK